MNITTTLQYYIQYIIDECDFIIDVAVNDEIDEYALDDNY